MVLLLACATFSCRIRGSKTGNVNGQDPVNMTKSDLLALMRARPVTLAFARHAPFAPSEEQDQTDSDQESKGSALLAKPQHAHITPTAVITVK